LAKSLAQYKAATIILGVSTGVLILLSLVLFSAWATSNGASSAADSSEGTTSFSSVYDVCNDSDVLQLDDDEETLSMEADTDDAYGPYQCLVGALRIPEDVQDEIEGDDDTGGASFDGITVRWRFTDDDNLQMTFKLTDGE
jgi:hypothetical protein